MNNLKKKSNSAKTKRIIGDSFWHILLGVLAFIWILPIIFLVLSSFRKEGGSFVNYFFPKSYTFNNYIKLFTDTKDFKFGKWYLNTLIVSVCTCIISSLFVLMVSYALSRLRFKFRKKIMNIILILGMFPGFMSMIAVYFILKAIMEPFGGTVQSLSSLVIVYSAGAGMGYYIAKGFFDTIPKALDEAAIIDGATRNDIFWKIILPLSKPIIVYTILMSFMGPWMDFIFVRVIMKDNYDGYTVSLGLWQMLTREFRDEYFLRFCAGSVLVATPITILFMVMQRFYVTGVTGGSVKG